MPKLIDLADKTFGRLTAIKRDSNAKKATMWLCQCECGSVKTYRTGNLTSGNTKSCGCYKREIVPDRFIDMTGQVFSRLTVVRRRENSGGQPAWECKCECGNTTIVRGSHLRNILVTSCGCYHKEKVTTHGHTKNNTVSKEYSTWISIINRTTNKKTIYYSAYGGRGIVMCDRWRNSFEAFFEDMGVKPGPKFTIERINNDGNYEPGNCRWATVKEQGRNKRSNRMLEWNGETLCIADWVDRLGISKFALRSRIANGWSVDRALSTPVLNRRPRTKRAKPPGIHKSDAGLSNDIKSDNR